MACISAAQCIAHMKKHFQIMHLVAIIIPCSHNDFGPVKGEELVMLGKKCGGVSLPVVVFCLDMMRLGMAEIYGCYRCGAEALAESRCRRTYGEEMAVLLEFFCENMLCIRNKMRFRRSTSTFFFNWAIKGNPALQARLTRDGLGCLKDVLHFSGLSLFQLMLAVKSEDSVFGTPDDRRQMDSAQLSHELALLKLGAYDNLPAAVKVDLWGNDGPDSMTHSFALFGKLSECQRARAAGGEGCYCGESRNAMSDFDFSSVPF